MEEPDEQEFGMVKNKLWLWSPSPGCRRRNGKVRGEEFPEGRELLRGVATRPSAEAGNRFDKEALPLSTPKYSNYAMPVYSLY